MKAVLLTAIPMVVLVACSTDPSVGNYDFSGGSSATFDSAGATGGGAGAAGGITIDSGIGPWGIDASAGTTGISADGSVDQGGASGSESGSGTGGFSGEGGSTLFDGGLGDGASLFDGGLSDGALPFDARSDLPSTDSGPDAGDAATYQPCPTNGDPCKILPLGDSITWGVGDEGNAGYRGPLFALTVAAQQKITFTGSVSNGPYIVSGQTFPRQNEGHSGWTISTVNWASNGKAGIASLIPSPAFDIASGGTPHIILMMIGTNDTDDSTATDMANRLAALMDKIIDAAPDALLVVAKITPKSWTESVVNAYNDAIPDLVKTRAAAGKHVMLADMNEGFTAAMMIEDNLHPNRTGYEFMANRWYSVIETLLP